MVRPCIVALLALAGLAGEARAQVDSSRAERPAAKLALLPIIFSSPDTRLALGALPQYIFHTAPGTRPSNLRADVYYTFNRQFNVLLKPVVWLPGDRWQFAGTFRFRKWPTSFYGIGPGSREEDEETFTEVLAHGSVEALRRVRPAVYVGASYVLCWGSIREVEPVGGLLDRGAVPGTGDSRVAGLGIVATYDTREHVYLPRSGALYRMQVERFARAFGPGSSGDYLDLNEAF